MLRRRTVAALILLGCALPNVSLAKAPPENGLLLWLDAGHINTDGASNLATGGRIETWTDQSGRGNHVSKMSGANGPSFETAALNGQPAVRFHGANALEALIEDEQLKGDQPFHAFLVMQADIAAPHPNPRLLDLQSGTDRKLVDRRGFWVGYQSNGRNRLGIVNGDEGQASSVAWNGMPHLVEVGYHGAQRWTHFLDGRTNGSGTYSQKTFLGFASPVRLTIGQHSGLTQRNTYYKGDLAEVLIYNRRLSVLEQNAVGQYLTRKYTLKTAYGPVPQFERDIKPMLTTHCTGCHGERELEADLDLRTVSSMLRGGQRGPVIVQGYPERSELLDLIVGGEMPPDESERLSDEQVALIRRWIRFRAPAKETIIEPSPADLITDKDRAHWAWQKPMPHKTPAVKQSHRVRNPVDAFVLHRLEDKGLTLSPDADRETLLRRVHLDLVGLPPSPEEIATFLADQRADAYERTVDRLLASPHFGERWGRHWLDEAGYVDVYGSDNDAAIIKPLTARWRYRDYVIRSFNHQKPFDRFILEQLAGDELHDWRSAERFTPEIVESLTATGFLLTAADDTDQLELNTLDIRHRVLQLTGEIVASNLLAVTLGCAKCHNHKYEAIPQQDYYRFLAHFAPSFNPEEWIVSTAHGVPDVSPARKTAIDQHNGAIAEQLAELTKRQSEVRSDCEHRLFDARLAKLPAPIRADVRTAVRTPEINRSPVQKYLVEKLGPLVEVKADDVTAALNDAEKSLLADLAQQMAKCNSRRQSYGTIQVVRETSPPTPTFLLRRGNHLRPGMEVQPGLLAILAEPNGGDKKTVKAAGNSSGRRLALARRLTDSQSLAGGHVARVIVNRFWQRLFGRGLVATSDNFGVSGSRPTHPELLDWLTLEFIRRGWKPKSLIRLLVTSSAYRQASANPTVEATASRIDPANDLLWKMRLRQLESEIVRDAILAVSGKLDRAAGGPPIPLDVQPDGRVVIKPRGLPRPADKWRRSVYVLARRNYQLSMLSIFDQPVVATNCTRRASSAVVTQSLTMLNDQFVLRHAEHFARRLAGRSSSADRVELAFRTALGRRPNEREARMCREQLARHTARFRREKLTETDATQRALAHLCHVLLNTNEFLYAR